MARSPADDAKAIVRHMVCKNLEPGQGYKRPAIVVEALKLGIEGADLDTALTYAGEQGWIEKGPDDTTVLTQDGHIAGQPL